MRGPELMLHTVSHQPHAGGVLCPLYSKLRKNWEAWSLVRHQALLFTDPGHRATAEDLRTPAAGLPFWSLRRAERTSPHPCPAHRLLALIVNGSKSQFLYHKMEIKTPTTHGVRSSERSGCHVQVHSLAPRKYSALLVGHSPAMWPWPERQFPHLSSGIMIDSCGC